MKLPWFIQSLRLTRSLSLTRRAASANVIIENHQHELLVLKANYKPYWSLPGGFIDKNETPSQASVREVKEEIGLIIDSDDLEFSAVMNRRSSMGDTYLFIFKLNYSIEKESNFILQPSEIDDYSWVSKNDINSRAGDRHYNRAVKNWASESPKNYLESVV